MHFAFAAHGGASPLEPVSGHFEAFGNAPLPGGENPTAREPNTLREDYVFWLTSGPVPTQDTCFPSREALRPRRRMHLKCRPCGPISDAGLRLSARRARTSRRRVRKPLPQARDPAPSTFTATASRHSTTAKPAARDARADPVGPARSRSASTGGSRRGNRPRRTASLGCSARRRCHRSRCRSLAR